MREFEGAALSARRRYPRVAMRPTDRSLPCCFGSSPPARARGPTADRSTGPDGTPRFGSVRR